MPPTRIVVVKGETGVQRSQATAAIEISAELPGACCGESPLSVQRQKSKSQRMQREVKTIRAAEEETGVKRSRAMAAKEISAELPGDCCGESPFSAQRQGQPQEQPGGEKLAQDRLRGGDRQGQQQLHRSGAAFFRPQAHGYGRNEEQVQPRVEAEKGVEIGDGMAAAAVEAVVALAGALADDARRKPLHHKCLMATRSASKRPRLLGLECVSRLAERLREEYLVFVPESVPFLSELLEDPEFEVEKRTQELVKQLEGLTGESLEPYMKT